MRNIILYICLLLAAASCNDNADHRLEKALELSGGNRAELEKVLAHYSADPADSLKLEAARFLISNMPGHYSLADEHSDGYFSAVGAKYAHISDVCKHVLFCLPGIHLSVDANAAKQDIEYIRADFLIEHINRKFNLWNAAPWREEVPFDDFCEYILPYRIGREPLEYLQTLDYRLPNTDSLVGAWKGHYIRMMAWGFYLQNTLFPVDRTTYALPYPVSNDNYTLDCTTNAFMGVLQNRLIGIPAAIDFTPDWPDRNGRHYWYYLFNRNQKNVTRSENTNAPYAKVYRKTYSHNQVPENNGRDAIPDLFKTPFNRDVTALYAHTKNVDITIAGTEQKIDHVYLCVFNESEWRPVAWSRVGSNGKALFPDVGVENLYLPVCYDITEQVAVGEPFILKSDGSLDLLTPDMSNRTELAVSRKYMLSERQLVWFPTLDGAVIRQHTDVDGDAIGFGGMFRLSGDMPRYNVISEKPVLSSHWILSVPAGRSIVEVAEIIFQDEAGTRINIKDIMTPEYPGYINFPKHNMIDGDMLTYSMVPGSIELILDDGAAVSRITTVAHNDDNNVVPGEKYELLYFGNGQWESLGQRIAHDYRLTYDNVPTGCLYLLRNLSKGREERPFIFKNGRIKFM